MPSVAPASQPIRAAIPYNRCLPSSRTRHAVKKPIVLGQFSLFKQTRGNCRPSRVPNRTIVTFGSGRAGGHANQGSAPGPLQKKRRPAIGRGYSPKGRAALRCGPATSALGFKAAA